MKTLREALKPSWIFPVLGMLLIGAAADAQKTASPTPALPTLTGLSETSVTTPTAAFTFTVTGTNFVLPARRRPGTEIATEEYGEIRATVNSATQITLQVPALRAVTTTTVLHLYARTPGVGRSPKTADLAFTLNPPVQGPAPTLTGLSETSVTTPTKAFTVTATGTNFVLPTATPFHTQVISVELGPLPTTVNSATGLTISFPGIRDVKQAVALHLYVKNPDNTESSTTAALAFTINPPVPGPPPTLTGSRETSVTTPTKASSFTVTGTNFVSGPGRRDQTIVETEEYGPLETSFDSATQLTVRLPRLRAVSAPIVVHLFVRNPDGARSASSADITFTINPPGATTTTPTSPTKGS